MSTAFWLQYTGALLVVALMLGGLYAIVRGLARGRVLASADRRLTSVLESTVLSQHAAIHVVKAGSRYLLLGASNGGGVTTLGELPAEDVETWIAEQRTLFSAQRTSLADAFKYLRGKP
ncbi:MAG TPA: flagellar biosynthetic protein FliO [Candidatus Baltobacteraceae bacterium]|jgi:flagellar biogenesis protein FliO|nr:flagellar biosynthetic protein FliO [Candidatus Baltobacteraceae bacterium]